MNVSAKIEINEVSRVPCHDSFQVNLRQGVALLGTFSYGNMLCIEKHMFDKRLTADCVYMIWNAAFPLIVVFSFCSFFIRFLLLFVLSLLRKK